MKDLNLSMFRAYDIRTPVADLPEDLALRLARAEAAYFRDDLGVPGVLVAHDARQTGPGCLQLAAEEYARAGLDVIVLPGVCSTSMFYYAAMRHPGLAAVMFGASHNPAGDTGQKLLAPGVRPVAQHIGPLGGLDRIQELYVAGAHPRPRSGRGATRAFDPTDEYVAYSLSLAGVRPGGLAGVPILHDYLNGAAGREMMLAFGVAGARLRPLHYAADGRFPLGDPNPVKAAVIREGLEVLTEERPLLGTFFDGDGDRIDFYAGDGRYLSSSFVYALILPHIRDRFPQAGLGVYADLKSNPLAVMEMARTGFQVQVIRNGHSQIKNSLFENPAMVGAVEESAHFYEAFLLDGARHCTENTLYIALLVARTWQEDPGRVERLFEIQGRTARGREWGYKFPSDHLRAQVLEAVERHFLKQGAAAMSRMANGLDLEATLMRRGIPFEIGPDTRLGGDWLQVCHRVSQSEDGLARWEVVAARPEIAREAKEEIARIAARFGAGEEYQG